MPTIVTIDNTRRNSRSMTVEQCNVYIRCMIECDDSNNENAYVNVDDSTSSNYETTYARCEKIRNAIKRFDLTSREIECRSIKNDNNEYDGVIRFK